MQHAIELLKTPAFLQLLHVEQRWWEYLCQSVGSASIERHGLSRGEELMDSVRLCERGYLGFLTCGL